LSGDSSQKTRAAVQRWAFVAVPLVGVVELIAHVAQTRPAASEADWLAARDYVAANAKHDDLVAFAPGWIDPVGRERFGASIATLEREARPDDSRFPRAFEVGIRGAHLGELRGWSKQGEQRFGGVTVTLLANPAPAHVIDDLVSHVDPARMRVSRGPAECGFQHERGQSGSLGFGPAIPGSRFVCPAGAFVAMSVVTDLDYVPHRCVYAPPTAGVPTRIVFEDVHFGTRLHGHHAIYVEAERNKTGQPVTLSFSVNGQPLASLEHRDGDGWKSFELDTSSLAGQTGELTAEVTSSGDRRMYCFEADTR
jgi:hypothetical protein